MNYWCAIINFITIFLLRLLNLWRDSNLIVTEITYNTLNIDRLDGVPRKNKSKFTIKKRELGSLNLNEIVSKKTKGKFYLNFSIKELILLL